MKYKITYRPRIRNSVAQKLISKSLAIGLFLNSSMISFAGILSEDGRYETFEGDYITIDNVLEEGNLELDEIQGNTMVNYVQDGDKELILNGDIDLEGDYITTTEGVDGGLVDVDIEGNTLIVNENGSEVEPGTEGAKLVSVGQDYMSDHKLEIISNNKNYAHINNVFDAEKNDNDKGWVLVDTDGKNFTCQGNGTIIDRNGFALGLNVYNLKPNTAYKISYKVDGEDADLNELCRNYIYKGSNTLWNVSLEIASNSFLFTTPGDTTNVCIGLYYSNPGNNRVVISDIQVEEAITQSEYITPSLNKKEILLNEPLRGLPNGVKDRIVKKDGKWYIERNLAEIELDYSDSSWNIYYGGRTDGSNTLNFNCLIGKGKISQYSKVISDRFIFTGLVNGKHGWDQDTENIYVSSDRIYITINKSSLLTQDVNGFKKWLSENPTTVAYQLATPIYEPLEIDLTLNTYSDITHISTNSTIPANMKVKNTGYDCILKPNTTYTVAVDTDKSGNIGINLGGAKGETDNNVLTLTTPEILVDNSLRLYGKGIKASNVRVLEGDVSDKIPSYFEGMQSSFENNIQDDGSYKAEVVSNNKNQFDYKNIDFNSIIIKEEDDKYVIPENSVKYWITSSPINVRPNTTYTIKLEGNDIYPSNGIYPIRWAVADRIDIQYDIDRDSVIAYAHQYDRVTFTTNANTHNIYIAFCTDGIYEETGRPRIEFKVHLEETSNSIEYSLHQSNKIQIQLFEPLRAVGDVKDRIIKRNGQWVVERNCAEITFDGSSDEKWTYILTDENNNVRYSIRGLYDKKIKADILTDKLYKKSEGNKGDGWDTGSQYNDLIYIYIKYDKLGGKDINSWRKYFQSNPLTVVYQLENPVYEPLNIDLSLYTYLDITHISNNSNIPTNMKIIYDRTINRAVDALELAKINPTVENLSKARMWINLLKEATLKDELQNEINDINNIEDLQLERKTTTSNVDIYIKSENMLLMSLSTNHITFNDYSGVEDIELNNAINISINSSLPYQLNSYLVSEIQNSDGSQSIDKSLFNIKDNVDNTYKQFNNINEKLVLKDDCESGNNKIHNIDLMLEGGDAHVADIYKTTIKFEAEQK